MIIELDQSGHVEYTSMDTVIGDSLGNSFKFASRDKRRIQLLYREAGKTRKFVTEIFSLLCSLVIKESFKKTHRYIIDIEYPGKDREIRQYIILFCKKYNIKIDAEQIQFSLVGKKSKSHETAYKRFKGLTKGKQVYYKDILKGILP